MQRGILLAFFLCTLATPYVHAEDFSSANFTVTAPVIQPGGYSTSLSFGLQSIVTQMTTGTSTASSFGENIGFLMYPFATTPSVSVTAGNAQVALSWNASSGFLGWTASGYSVGQSTSSGGPYSYTDLGNVTSSTRTGLTNDTAYYFVIVVEDAFGNFIATSTEVSATPTGGGQGSPGGSGGSGGSSSGSGNSSVVFSGRAYPLSKVVLLKDAQIAVTTIAGPDANFHITLFGLAAGPYLFSIHTEDKDGRRSRSFTFPVTLTTNAATNVGGIFIAPTIDVDKTHVRKGDNITVFGQAAPEADVVINVNSENNLFYATESDKNGVYLFSFDTSPLEFGDHSARSKSSLEGLVSDFGHLVNFAVGFENIKKEVVSMREVKGDMNDDGRVNVIDFSVAAYWYGRPSPLAKVDINGDGVISIVDFSIMAFYWTG